MPSYVFAFGLLTSAMTLGIVLPLTVVLRRTDVAGLATLQVLAAGTWLIGNKGAEGRVLLPLTPSHGLTSADLFAAVPLLVGLWLLARAVEHEREVRRSAEPDG